MTLYNEDNINVLERELSYSIYLIIGPSYNNLEKLLYTINNNLKLLKNIKKIYLPTNDINIYNYFTELNNPNITVYKFAENQGHQLSCYNSIIAGMKMLLIDNIDINNNDKVIFSHEDCYINNLELLNKAINKLNNGYDVVCREFNAVKMQNYKYNYYMNDTFIININCIKEIYNNKDILLNFNSEGNPIYRFCEFFFTNDIKKLKVYSIIYEHTTWWDTELGFYHIPSGYCRNIKWDKKNIDDIY